MNDLPHQLRRAPDLGEFEEALASRFGELARHAAPSAVRQALVCNRPVRGPRVLRFVPLGAWGLASAALVLLALGAAVFIEVSTPMARDASAVFSPIGHLTIVEDSRLALFHKVETFDDVGLAPGRVLADWGR